MEEIVLFLVKIVETKAIGNKASVVAVLDCKSYLPTIPEIVTNLAPRNIVYLDVSKIKQVKNYNFM